MQAYVVRVGDHLREIAFRHGLAADAIWNHPKNESLKASRGNGNILCPGDILYLPDPETRVAQTIEPGGRYEFTLAVPTQTVSINLTSDANTFAACDFEVHGAGAVITGTTGGAGELSFQCPVHVREVLIKLPTHNAEFHVRIGGMDPIDERSGIRARLEHLGFYASLDTAHNDDELYCAIRLFQSSQGLEPTGTLDDPTRSALLEAHGS